MVFKPLSHAVHCRIKGLLDGKTANSFYDRFFFFLPLVAGGLGSQRIICHTYELLCLQGQVSPVLTEPLKIYDCVLKCRPVCKVTHADRVISLAVTNI